MKTSLSSFVSRPTLAATLLLVGLVLVAGGPASARSPVDQVQRGFELIDDYLVMKNGQDLDARIYSSSTTKAILIVPADMATAAVMIWPRTREVESLKSMKVQSLAGGFVEVKKDAVAALNPPFEVVGTNVVFDVAGAEMRLKPKPPVLGLKTAPEMLERSAVYARRAESYTPSQEVLDKLAGLNGNARVRVFFGSWCPACGQMVPRMLKVAEKLGESNLEFDFYGLPKGEGFSADPQVRAYGIKSVPTGLVFVDGKEVGRIEGNDWRSPESTLWDRLGS